MEDPGGSSTPAGSSLQQMPPPPDVDMVAGGGGIVSGGELSVDKIVEELKAQGIFDQVGELERRRFYC